MVSSLCSSVNVRSKCLHCETSMTPVIGPEGFRVACPPTACALPRENSTAIFRAKECRLEGRSNVSYWPMAEKSQPSPTVRDQVISRLGCDRLSQSDKPCPLPGGKQRCIDSIGNRCF